MDFAHRSGIDVKLHPLIPQRWRRRLRNRSSLLLFIVCLVLVPTIIQILLARSSWSVLGSLDATGPITAVDYVGMVQKPSCVNRFAIARLVRYQKPRSIILVVPDVDACMHHLAPLSPNIRCVQEDSIHPQLSKAIVQDELQNAYPQVRESSGDGRWNRTGWYLQQLLKLGVVEGLPQLSDFYVIWDMDMIPTRRLPIFFSSTTASFGPQQDYDAEDDAGLPSGVRTRVNIGGAWPQGYRLSYKQLFDREPLLAEDGTSFVSHWIVVHKPRMQEFLRALSPGDGISWQQHILRNLPEADLWHGFSEFHSYISWLKQQHPEEIAEAPRKTWLRQPVGGSWGIRAASWLTKGGYCCPTRLQHWVQWLAGLEYYGVEVGHHSWCATPAVGDFYGPQ
eukprot:jgi/Ulvmu1/6471/UM003_0102.1